MSECHECTHCLAKLHTSTFETEATCTSAILALSPTATWRKNPRKELRPILTNCFPILENPAIGIGFALGNSCESRNSITQTVFFH
jgi:hypothetical protein